MSCLQTVEAMTDASEGALTGWKKVRYRVHITICPFCRAHRRQVEATIDTLKGLPSPIVDESARTEALGAFRRKHSL
jgi:anti-sigma factor RsiW